MALVGLLTELQIVWKCRAFDRVTGCLGVCGIDWVFDRVTGSLGMCGIDWAFGRVTGSLGVRVVLIGLLTEL